MKGFQGSDLPRAMFHRAMFHLYEGVRSSDLPRRDDTSGDVLHTWSLGPVVVEIGTLCWMVNISVD